MFGDLGKVMLHEIARGIGQAKRGPELEKRLHALAQFLQDFPELREIASLSKLQADETLFQDVAGLSEEFCGTFWERLISALPVRAYYDNEGPATDSLLDLFLILGQLYEYFSGTEDDNGGQKRKWELQDAFTVHWGHYIQTHPDGARAKRLLSRGEFPRGEDICREILIAEGMRHRGSGGVLLLEGNHRSGAGAERGAGYRHVADPPGHRPAMLTGEREYSQQPPPQPDSAEVAV